MRSARALLLLVLLCPSVLAQKFPDMEIDPKQIIRVYDGDTFFIHIPNIPAIFGEELGVRVIGVDTPEIRSTCKSPIMKEAEKLKAEEAREFLAKRLRKAKRIVVREPDHDKFFRVVGRVELDGKDIAPILIKAGHAYPYYGKKKRGWCQ